MKRTLAVLLLLSFALFMTGCTDRQVRDALVDMGYAPADPDQSPAPTPDQTPAPDPTVTPQPTLTPTPTPRPDNVGDIDDIIDVDGYPESIKLNKKKLTLTVGQTKKLKVTLKPKKAKIKAVTWSSDDETIATVSDKGKVKGVSAGTTVITCETRNGLKVECEITVKQKKSKAAALMYS